MENSPENPGLPMGGPPSWSSPGLAFRLDQLLLGGSRRGFSATLVRPIRTGLALVLKIVR
jgi:hypothetical protein